MIVLPNFSSSKYLHFNLLGKEVGQKPMNQHLEECLSLILLMADSLIISSKEQSPLVVVSFPSSSLKLSIEYYFLILQGVVSKKLNNELNEVKQ
jgi:hypothetical protein